VKDVSKKNGNFPKLLSFLSKFTFLLTLSLLIGGIGGQIQTAIFGDELIPSIASGKVLLVICMIILIVLRGKAALSYSQLFIVFALIFSAYLIILTLVLTIFARKDLNELIGSYIIYYFYLLILPLAYNLRNTISHQFAFRSIVVLGVPVTILGIAQYALSDPLLATSGYRSHFKIQSWEFYGGVRGFSLGVSPFDIGFFLVLLLCMIFVKQIKRLSDLRISFCIIFVAIAIYSTITRNVILEAIYAAIAVLVIVKLSQKHLIVKLLPLIFAVFNFVIIQINSQSAIRGRYSAGIDRDISNSATLGVRLGQWNEYINNIRLKSLFSFFFGDASVQTDKFGSQNILLDNTYLAIFAHSGIIGLILVVFTIYAMYLFALRKAQLSSIHCALAATLSAALAVGVFNIAVSVYGILMIMSLMVNSENFHVNAPLKRIRLNNR